MAAASSASVPAHGALVTGQQFKEDLLAGKPKIGLFLNSGSQAVAQQLSWAGYDWILIDTQHGAMEGMALGALINALHLGRSLVMVRVGSAADRPGIQQALDLGADGILVPYINTAAEAKEAVSCCHYPTAGTRSVYFPQPCMNKDGLLGYAGRSSKDIVVAIQVETADCVKNIDEILSIKGLDLAFLGQNDLCLSMGLYEKYEFPKMYFSDELNAATAKLIETCKKYSKIPGIFLFGTDRVEEFVKKGFTFISVGNDLHHIRVTAETLIKKSEEIFKATGKQWTKPASTGN